MDFLLRTQDTAPIFVTLFMVVAVLYPLLRLYRKTGEWGLVLQDKTRPIERVVSGWTVVVLLAVALWVAFYTALGSRMPGLLIASSMTILAGTGLMCVSLLLVVIAQAQMGAAWRIGIGSKDTGLVKSGLFKWIRHPIYTGILGMLLGLCLAVPSTLLVALTFFALILLMLQARLEEMHLGRFHGQEYSEYMGRSGRFLPNIGRVVIKDS